MIIRRLEISHLRNLNTVTLSLNPRFNYLYGPNGAGKTSVLEAVHLLARGRSFRGRRIAPIVQNGERNLLVRAELEDGRSLGLFRERSGKTQRHVDRTEVKRLSDAAALLPIHLILPGVSDLVFGGPAERRHCLDWGMFHVKPGYLQVLRSYLSAVKQRNAVLKSWNTTGSNSALQAWTDTLCEKAEPVHELRKDYISRLIPGFETALAELEANFSIEIDYRKGWGDGELAKYLRDSLDNDVKSGATGLGPHRADLSFRVLAKDAGAILSRGQGKLTAIALVLAQAQLLKSVTGHGSVFLIDDLGAELDHSHSTRMLALLRAIGCQVISTSTRSPFEELNALFGSDNVALFHVKQGGVEASA